MQFIFKDTSMKRLLAACVALAFTMPFASADMIDRCRSCAASHLNADPRMINVEEESARVDGTIPVNGEVEGTGITFQCSFNSAGTRIVQWWNSAPEHCPPDVSEADRYL